MDTIVPIYSIITESEKQLSITYSIIVDQMSFVLLRWFLSLIIISLVAITNDAQETSIDKKDNDEELKTSSLVSEDVSSSGSVTRLNNWADFLWNKPENSLQTLTLQIRLIKPIISIRVDPRLSTSIWFNPS